MSESTAVMAFDGVLGGDGAEEMANRRIPYGNDDQVCRLFQTAGMVSRLLVAAGERALPFTFLWEGSTRYSGVSDPTWSIGTDMVRDLNKVISGLDDDWAKKTMRPWGKSFIAEIRRAKKAGATLYRNSDPVKMYEVEMEEHLLYFNRLKKYIQKAADGGMSLLVCC